MAQVQGLLVTTPNAVLEQQARDMELAALPQIILTPLAQHCLEFISRAQSAKVDVEQQLIKDLQQRAGVYDAETLALITDEGGTDMKADVFARHALTSQRLTKSLKGGNLRIDHHLVAPRYQGAIEPRQRHDICDGTRCCKG